MVKNLFLLCGVLVAAVLLSCQSTVSQHQVHQFKAFNGITFEYGLLLPDNYDPSQKHEVVSILCEVATSDNAWEETMALAKTLDLNRTILIIPRVPVGEEHWGTHPIHHAFNDLIKTVRKSHGGARQNLHLLGLGAGQETAFWWTYASKDLITSTAVSEGALWKEERWDKRWYDNLMASGVPVFAYEQTVSGKFAMPGIQFTASKSLQEIINDIVARNPV